VLTLWLDSRSVKRRAVAAVEDLVASDAVAFRKIRKGATAVGGVKQTRRS
jgi:hypothetical protein